MGAAPRSGGTGLAGPRLLPSVTGPGSPHREPAAEAHHLDPDVLEARPAPCLDCPGDGIPAVVPGDIGAEEAPDEEPLPAAREQPAGRGQPPGIEPPPESPEPRGRAEEIHAGNPSPRPRPPR